MACSFCSLKFDWQRWRHHCRACGACVCAQCSSKQALIPVDRLVLRPTSDSAAAGIMSATGMDGGEATAALKAREPKRVCDSCHAELLPLQEHLTRTYANAAQGAAEPSRGLFGLTSPLAFSMETEVAKAATSVRHFFKHDVSTELLEDEDLPKEVLMQAQGIAFLTIVKFGIGVTYRGGTGLVMARLPGNQGWSAPSAIGTVGVGWGAQLGAELTEFVILLNTKEAVEGFSGLGQVTLGAEIGIAAGPVGRRAGAAAASDAGSVQACYSYSRSKGLFIGISLEGAVIYARDDVNTKFYGSAVNRSDLLDGSVQQPRAAQSLYDALDRHLGQSSAAALAGGSGAAATGGASTTATTGGGARPAPLALADAMGSMGRVPRPGSPPTPITAHGAGRLHEGPVRKGTLLSTVDFSDMGSGSPASTSTGSGGLDELAL